MHSSSTATKLTFALSVWILAFSCSDSESARNIGGEVIEGGGSLAFGPDPEGMAWVQGGEFLMGCDGDWTLPEERPAHRVQVDSFWIDRFEVTNSQFAAFVDATGYVTTSEQPTPLERIMEQLPPGSPAPDPSMLVPGSAVFVLPVEEGSASPGWTYVTGANWRQPFGPGSSITDKQDHPVVQVSWWDAMAYAEWAEKSLPSEAQWEFAARGTLAEAKYVWGDEHPDTGIPPLNMWQGVFPMQNLGIDQFMGTAPVGQFPANGHGLSDMAGNVWEWCGDSFDPNLFSKRSKSDLTRNPYLAPSSVEDLNPRSLRGGSFLCSDSFCTRYRPSARTGNTPDSATNHMGFRCVRVPDDLSRAGPSDASSDPASPR